MTATIALFELRQRLRRISTYLYFLVLFALGFLFALIGGGAFPSVSLDFGTGGKVFINSPFSLNAIISFLSVFGVIITAAIAGQAAGPVGALLAALDARGHTAAAIDAAAELHARGAVVVDLAAVDLHGVAVGLIALAGLGDDQNAPGPVESRLRLRARWRHAAKRRRGGQKEV